MSASDLFNPPARGGNVSHIVARCATCDFSKHDNPMAGGWPGKLRCARPGASWNSAASGKACQFFVAHTLVALERARGFVPVVAG